MARARHDLHESGMEGPGHWPDLTVPNGFAIETHRGANLSGRSRKEKLTGVGKLTPRNRAFF